jgi:hypothetical protein
VPENFDSHCTLNESAVSFTVQDFKFAAPVGAFMMWGLCLPLALATLTRGNIEYMECANKINV